jgi:ribonuclease P protein component
MLSMPVAPKVVRNSPSKGLAEATYGFPRKHRLSSPADFQYVFAKAQKSADAYLTVLARPNGREHARLGLAIAKKSLRKATDRNRIKRLVRESFRLHHASLGGLDFVVMARAGARQADGLTLRTALEQHWASLIRRCNSC